MGTTIQNYILAIVTLHPDKIKGGGAPVFIVDTEEQLQRTAFLIEKIMVAMAHDLENGTLILVRH